MGTTLFLVFRDPGPCWVRGRSTREQAGWEEHALFMDRIFEQGRIVLAGPYADHSRVLLIIQASNRDEAAHLLDGDPWNAAGILGPPEVIEWKVFLDSR
ncbi:MAG: YciI family protein [Thermoanaerobaculia bacterium]